MAVPSRFRGKRRLVLSIALQFANRRFAFAFVVVSALVAKVIHIYSHRSALPMAHLLLWGYSFFAQDMALLVVVCLLLDQQMFSFGGSWLGLAIANLTSIFVTYVVVPRLPKNSAFKGFED
ncbi:hypothetical protein PT974_09985 [Cladobotryum mycophilum]|uniref:Uncharacterized protein n=1 Tax=Cladobotryum mycophilum TaxID=491253 RepID=A0ABR0S9I1_9HYPO